MSAKLKVYGWSSFRGIQVRVICASPSKAAMYRSGAVEPKELVGNCAETGNKRELEVALANPGTVFWIPLSEQYNKDAVWRQDEKKEST